MSTRKALGTSAVTERAQSPDKIKDVVEVKEVRGSEAFNEALLKEPVTWHHPRLLMLLGVLLVGFFCQTMNGYDTVLFGGLLNNQYFLDHFHGENAGIWAGLITSMYQIGGVCALPFVGPAIDTWGRRPGMFIGSVLIILGVITTGLTVHNASKGQIMGGRFLLGFGVSIAAAAGPIWVVETSHPKYRGIITGFCNTTWLAGAILCAGAVRGGLDTKGTTSWQIPTWLQMVFPGLIAVFAFFLPESPRWLYTRNKREKAVQTLTYWHGFGNPDSVWVRLQLNEYEEFLEMDGSDKRFWDYRKLFDSRASFYRINVNCWFSAFSQWCGNGPLSYFMGAVLDTAGYHASITKANIQLGYSVFQFVFAVIGANFVELIGRRKMMLAGFFGTSLIWIGMTVSAAEVAAGLPPGERQLGQDSVSTNGGAGKAMLAFIFIFGAVYSFNITPLQALYPVEVLSFEMRAKGMAFQSLFVNAAGLLNQFAWPVALKRITWHTYIIFIIWTAAQGVLAYFLFPETRKRTLEELDRIFEAPSPVKYSTQKHQLGLTEDKTVVHVEQA